MVYAADALKLIVTFICLHLIELPYTYIILLTALILLFTPATKRLSVLAAANVISIVFFGGVFLDALQRNNRLEVVMRNLQPESYFAHQIVLRLAALGLAVLIVLALAKYIRAKNPFAQILSACCTIALLTFFMSLSNKWPYMQILFWSASILIAKHIWIILYTYQGKVSQVESNASRLSSLVQILSCFSFWSIITAYHIHNIPRGVSELDNTKSTSVSKSIQSAFYCALLSLTFGVITHYLWSFFFSYHSWFQFSWLYAPIQFEYPSVTGSGLKVFNSANFGLLTLWMLTLAQGICFLFKNASMMFAIVSVVRLSGFTIPTPIKGLDKTTGFASFMSRYYYYYSDLLAHFFYYPFLLYIDKFNINPRIKKFLAAFYSVFCGGLLVHLILEYYAEANLQNNEIVLLYTILRIPYFFTLALFVSISDALPKSAKTQNRYLVLLSVMFFSLLYSFAYSLQSYMRSLKRGFPVDYQDYLEFLKALFSL